MTERKATLERLNAFSDGVFSIIITILVLELNPPAHPTFRALLALWPTGLSYVVSYFFVAIVWVNHHHVLQYAEAPTPRLIRRNFAHLFSVSLVPFSTAWMARTRLAGVPVALEAGVFVLVNVTYVALLWETFERTDESEISAQARRMMRVRSFLTLGAFSIAMVLSVKFPLCGLGLVCCCLVFYLRPEAPHGGGNASRFLATLRTPWRP
jgi:TMEM175 potassium channel family protein